MIFSLVVSTLGRKEQLNTLLRSLATQSFKNFEVIIVDQNDDDRLREVVDQAAWPFLIRHIRTPDDRGVCRGRNVGLAVAEGDMVSFPDDDCWYPPWFLEKAAALLETQDCASVTGRAADESGRSINGRFMETAEWVNKANVWVTQIEWVAIFRASVLRAIGGFDETIGIGSRAPWQASEGQDVTLRLYAAGYRTYYDPSLYGFHAELDVTSPSMAMISKARGYARGFGYVLRRHDYGFGSLTYWAARSLAGGIWSLMNGNFPRARYYLNVTLGRIEGWINKTM